MWPRRRGAYRCHFSAVESRRLAFGSNEGKSRFWLAATKCHIAMAGIEKILPSERDFTLFLNLLARSGSGRQLTVYTELMNGSRGPAQPDGPEEMHMILVNYGRAEGRASERRPRFPAQHPLRREL